MYAVYTTSMGSFPYSTKNHQFKIPPIVIFEQIVEYLTHNNSAYTVYVTHIIPTILYTYHIATVAENFRG